MVQKNISGKSQKSLKRFSVSLEAEEYEQLQAVIQSHRPRLSLQYVTRYAIVELLAKVKDPQFINQLRNPIGGKS